MVSRAVETILITIAILPIPLSQVVDQERPSASVTFTTPKATALQAVIQVAEQTRQPLGIEFGEHPGKLCEIQHVFNIQNESTQDALVKSLQDTGYSVEDEAGVLVIVAPDLMTWQRSLLDYRYESFSTGAATTMAGLGARLTGWMQMEVGHVPAFGGSVRHSPDAQRFQIGPISGASTEDIANRIVNLDSKGIWILKPTIANPKGAADEQIKVYSYRDDLGSLQQLTCDGDETTGSKN